MVRIKNRYLLVTFLYPDSGKPTSSREQLPDLVQFHQPSSDQLNPGLLIRAIKDAVAEHFGDYGVGVISTGLKVNYLSTATSTAIIRSPRAHYQLVWAALTFMTRLPKPISQPVVVRVVRVSGTIRKSEEEVIRRAKDIIMKAKSAEMSGGPAGDIIKAAARAGTAKAVHGRAEDDVLAGVDEDESDSE